MNKTLRAALAGIIGGLLVLNVIALITINPSTYPKKWDARLAPLAAFVEDARHLRFEHPVPVRFLTPEEYKKEIAGEQEPSEEDDEYNDIYDGEMRALGLIGQETNTSDDQSQIETEGTAAFYDEFADEIVVYGLDFDITTKVTLVHELTHALQDQTFDLARDFDTSGAYTMFHALGEGDATRVEELYVRSLSEQDQEAYFNSFDEEPAEGEVAEPDEADDHNLDDVAPVLLQQFDAPYALGGPMTKIIERAKDIAALDALFRNPPESEEGLFDVFALLNPEEPKRVRSVGAPNSAEVVDEGGQLGAITWYLMLASYIDPLKAMQAVDGWGGDTYVGYEQDDKICVKAAFVGDTPTDTAEMRAALSEWRDAFSPTTVTIGTSTERAIITSCEPGAAARKPRADAGSSLDYPVVRMELLAQVFDQKMPANVAECFVNRLIANTTIDKLLSDDESVAKEMFQLGVQVGQSCARELGVTPGSSA